MDCGTIARTICTLFFAKAFGVGLSGNDYVMLVITVLLLSMGAPGIPGAGILCQSVLLAQFGIPMEALTIYVAVNSILDPFVTADNVIGDITGTFIVAKRTQNVITTHR